MSNTTTTAQKFGAFLLSTGAFASLLRLIASSPVLATHPLTSLIG